MRETLDVDLYANEHVNMDSLPFRYGFQFPSNTVMTLYNICDLEQQSNDRVKLTASFIDIDGNEQSGTFILMKKSSPLLKVVTIWLNDKKDEFYLSELMKNLRKDKKIRVSDLIDLHPRYRSGKLVTMSALFDALIMKKEVNLTERDSVIEEKIKNKYEDQIRSLHSENLRVTNIAQIAIKGLNERDNIIKQQETEIKDKENKYNLLVTEFEEYKKENQRAGRDRTISVATLSEETTLQAVNRNIIHRGSSCTELVFSNGKRKYMKISTFDPNLSITSKAERLINKQVRTTCWDPVNEPGKWSRQGYFRGIYEVETNRGL